MLISILLFLYIVTSRPLLVNIGGEPFIEFSIYLLRYVFCTLIVIIATTGFSNSYLAMLGGYLFIDNFIIGMIVTEKRYYSSNKIINILMMPTELFRWVTPLPLYIVDVIGTGISKAVKNLFKEPD